MIKLDGKTVVNFGNFPNKESNLPLQELKTKAFNYVEWSFEDEREIVQLAILKSHIDSIGQNAALSMVYMPHSRMDRTSDHYAFSLKAVAGLINAMKWNSVLVTDPHSDVTPAILDRCVVWNWVERAVERITTDYAIDSLFYPDAGAAKKYFFGFPYACGHKHRDFLSGKITSFDIFGEVNNTVLIVDDMCSRGGTLVHSAKKLREHGANRVFAVVNYCEDTIFDGEVFDNVDKVFINSMNIMSQENQKLIKL